MLLFCQLVSEGITEGVRLCGSKLPSHRLTSPLLRSVIPSATLWNLLSNINQPNWDPCRVFLVSRRDFPPWLTSAADRWTAEPREDVTANQFPHIQAGLGYVEIPPQRRLRGICFGSPTSPPPIHVSLLENPSALHWGNTIQPIRHGLRFLCC